MTQRNYNNKTKKISIIFKRKVTLDKDLLMIQGNLYNTKERKKVQRTQEFKYRHVNNIQRR